MDFNKALKIGDADFEDILEIMKLRRAHEEVDAVRNLLFTVNLVIDYYLSREAGELKIPVVYFPVCNTYSQELCEDFVCLKFGFYTNQEWKSYISKKIKKNFIYIPSDVKTKKQRDLLTDNHKFEQKLSVILNRSIHEYYNNGCTMLYSDSLKRSFNDYNEAKKSWNRKTVNKYWYLARTITTLNSKSDSSCPLMFVPDDVDEFYNAFVENEKKIRIENIVVFPTKTPDGRYSDYCSEIMQKSYFDDFVDAKSGLRNVFFFCFSRKPYRLRRLFDFKQRMKERIQIYDDNTLDFVSFTYEESLLLNGKIEQKHPILLMGKEKDEIQVDYENILDDITMGLDRYVSRRNEMSLCIPSVSHDFYTPKLSYETEEDERLLYEIFKINSKLWDESVDVFMSHFVFYDDIFVITGNDIDFELKCIFKKFLIDKYFAKTISFGTFGDLRGYQVNGEYVNEIKQKKIIVVSFRNDYTESIFHKYPNSFDPFCVNQDQQLVEISNYFFMRQYYEWGKYNYGKAIRKILRSEFRTSKMKPVLIEYKRPTKKLPDDTREEEMDRNANRTIPQIQITSTNDTKHSYARSEWMLYEYRDSMGIAPLSDLCDIYESYEDLKIQSLTPLVRLVLKNYIDSEREKDTRSERLFKEQPTYGLLPEEIASDVQLWKILLQRRVDATSEKTVYEDIMSHFDERYVISFHSFRRWLDPDYGIPRARKMQKYLMEDYLGIRPPYINLVRRIKERTKSDTESISISVRHFLSVALLSKDYKSVFLALSEETKDLLDISKVDDVIKIVSDVKNKIQFESIKKIEQ